MRHPITAMPEQAAPGAEAPSNRILGLTRLLERVDARLARVFVPWAIRHPRHFRAFMRLARAYERSQAVRAQTLEDGVSVPPFLVLSVTSRCNLQCAGCFARAIGTTGGPPPARPPLGLGGWHAVVEESAALGVIGFVIAGGEPFMLPGIASLFQRFSDRLFVVFTNGTALRDGDLEILRDCPNTVVVVSIEGDRVLTDGRRGTGVFDSALGCLDRLRAAGILTGLSVTIGSANIDYWSQAGNIDALLARTGPLAFFLEEVKAGECEAGAATTPEQRSRFRETVVRYRNRRSGAAYIVHSPADEDVFGGCVSAGRGFAHVNPSGDVTACPMSALATHNVSTSTLYQAFASPLFTMIRDSGHLFETSDHPCGLFANAGKLESMAKSLGAYRTGPADSVALGAR